MWDTRVLIPRQMKKMHKQDLFFTCPFRFVFHHVLDTIIIFIWGKMLLFVVGWGPPYLLYWIFMSFHICLGFLLKFNFKIAFANNNFEPSKYFTFNFPLVVLIWLLFYKFKSRFRSILITWKVLSSNKHECAATTRTNDVT